MIDVKAGSFPCLFYIEKLEKRRNIVYNALSKMFNRVKNDKKRGVFHLICFLLHNKQGSEMLQVLIVIAIFGAIAMTVLSDLSGSMASTTETMLQNTEGSIESSGAQVN